MGEYKEAFKEYGVILVDLEEVQDVDCIILAVAHNEFRALSLNKLKSMFGIGSDNEKVLIDVKGIYSVQDLKESGMRYWRL